MWIKPTYIMHTLEFGKNYSPQGQIGCNRIACCGDLINKYMKLKGEKFIC